MLRTYCDWHSLNFSNNDPFPLFKNSTKVVLSVSELSIHQILRFYPYGGCIHVHVHVRTAYDL